MTRDFWRVEEEEFVNDSRGEGSAIERGASLQQNIQDFAASEFSEDGSQVDPAPFCLDL